MATGEATTGTLSGGGSTGSRVRPVYLDGEYVPMMATIPDGLATTDDMLTVLHKAAYNARGWSVDTTTSYTILATDAGSTVSFSNAAAVTVIVPTNAVTALPIGYIVHLYSEGAGGIVLDTTGLTTRGTSPTTAAVDTGLTLQKVGTNQWLVRV